MRRPVFFLLVILLILPSAIPAQAVPAQIDGWLYSSCDEQETMDLIAPTTDVLDFQSACEQYNSCNPYSNDNDLCQFSVFRSLLEQCPLDDARCPDGAILFAAALSAYEGYSPPQEIIERVPSALEAFWNGDDAGALVALQIELPADYFDDDTMIPFMRGVLYERLGQPELALAEYADAYRLSFVHPLVSYVRAQLYGELGRLDEASFDANAVALYLADNPELSAFVAPLQAQYPLDEIVMQDWLYYPVSTYSSGVVGYFVDDLTLEPPRPIQLGIYDDLNLVVAIGLKNWSTSGFGSGDYSVLQILQGAEDGTSYRLIYPSYDENGGAINLTEIEGGAFSGSEFIQFFEGGGRWSFMIAPVGAPDPRTTIAGTRYCEGGVISMLGIGAFVASARSGSGVPLADIAGNPTFTSEEEQGTITVVGGPVCVGSVTWWQGYNTYGNSGWFAENDGTTYAVLRTTMNPDYFYCDGNPPSLPPRLSVNTTALVLPALDANNVRDFPSSEGEILGIIPPDATFEIIGGPVCIENIIWWYADYNGLIGWTAEGADDTYWLAPVE